MKNSLTIVLENNETLSELCGSNDKNIQMIENLLESRVFYRGNELFLESNDKVKHSIFKELISNLIDYTNDGRFIDSDIINAVYETIKQKDKATGDLLKRMCINVPGNNKSVYPRSIRQAKYIESMGKKDIVFGIGPAGTGKTYLAIAYALKMILSKEKKRLILTRPVVEAGESLGFLPGDLTQKISPYLRPLYDAMDSLISFETITRMEENRIIEIAPLAYMRGRSIADSLIILDEAQNTTREQMKMFLTRIGQGSQAIITGDVTQIDLPGKAKSGLFDAMKVLKNIEEIEFNYFDAQDVVRNPVVRKIVRAYEKEEEK